MPAALVCSSSEQPPDDTCHLLPESRTVFARLRCDGEATVMVAGGGVGLFCLSELHFRELSGARQMQCAR